MRIVHCPARAALLFVFSLGTAFIGHSLLGWHAAPQESMSFSVAGRITQHKDNQLTVNTEGNIVFRVVYSEKTSVARRDGSAGSPKDLTVGTRIHVDGELTESGEIIAGKIQVRDDPSAK